MGPKAAPPQKPTPAAMQAVYQRNYTETVCQLALFPPGREALLGQAAILKALEEVAARGLTPEAQEHAQGALMALRDKEMHASDAEGPKHIMLSYQVCPSVSLAASCPVLRAVFVRLPLTSLHSIAVGQPDHDPAHPQRAA